MCGSSAAELPHTLCICLQHPTSLCSLSSLVILVFIIHLLSMLNACWAVAHPRQTTWSSRRELMRTEWRTLRKEDHRLLLTLCLYLHWPRHSTVLDKSKPQNTHRLSSQTHRSVFFSPDYILIVLCSYWEFVGFHLFGEITLLQWTEIKNLHLYIYMYINIYYYRCTLIVESGSSCILFLIQDLVLELGTEQDDIVFIDWGIMAD